MLVIKTFSERKKIFRERKKCEKIRAKRCHRQISGPMELNGVESAVVSPLQGQAIVKYVPELVGLNTINGVVKDVGFEVKDISEQDIEVCRLRIKGMMCTSCYESVKCALLMVESVKKAAVGLAREEAKINYDPNVITTDRIIEAVKDANFGADLIGLGNDGNKVHIKIEGISSLEDMTVIKSSLDSLTGVNHVQIDMEECKFWLSGWARPLVDEEGNPTGTSFLLDVPLLDSGTYRNITEGGLAEDILKKEKITLYVEHPRPIEPPAESAPPPPQPLKLT
ncbi:copper-transporting ATPase HMA4-like protein [Tanacetum coccineum]|uniref:Copper-transporting ATPase HMA4-like protein n=1 Tax=Tanacetum coccineum TaxID=301880 RepID=A0ABQ5HWT4_9ASTR